MPGGIYSSHIYHSYYYGVSTSDATETRREYAAKAGYSGYKYISSLSGWKGRWGYGVFFRYDNLKSAVIRQSPLVETQVNLTSGIGFIYLFYSESKM